MKPQLCNVGITGTADDRLRLRHAVSFLSNNNYMDPLDFGKLRADCPDLIANKRDFLAEKTSYDIVILHFLFRGSNFRLPIEYHPELCISPLNSWDGWRKRLQQTKARFIFAYGGCTEISGGFIGTIPGYNLYSYGTASRLPTMESFDAEKDFWVFVRADLPRPTDPRLMSPKALIAREVVL